MDRWMNRWIEGSIMICQNCAPSIAAAPPLRPFGALMTAPAIRDSLSIKRVRMWGGMEGAERNGPNQTRH